MKVLVVGSLTGLSSDSHESFRIACRALGRSLCKRGHSLIVCSNHPNHADNYVLAGFIETKPASSSTQSITVSFGDPADDENNPDKFRTEKEIATLKKLKWIEVDTSGEYPFNRIGVVKTADAIIIIGGQEGTKYMASTAYALEKTLVPLYWWGGGVIWSRLEAAFKRELQPEHFRYLSSEQSSDADWEGVVIATEHLYVGQRKRDTRSNSSAVRRVLSIDGGGIRGILPALFLADFERKTGKPTRDLFDLVIGTSTGGIIALALTQLERPISATEMLDTYLEHSGKIFGSARSSLLSAFSKPRYSSKGLKELGSLLYGKRQLSETSVPTAVTAYDIVGRRPRILRSWDLSRSGIDNCYLWEAAIATSAAPTYFPPARIEDQSLIDGGVFANNPSAIALAEAKGIWPNDQIMLTSLGTGISSKLGHLAGDVQSWGSVNWIGPLIDIMFDGSSDSVHHVCKSLCGASNYHRFQITLHPELGQMDNVQPSHLSQLKAAGLKAVEEQQDQIALALNLLSTAKAQP